jgi:hypothetical protein
VRRWLHRDGLVALPRRELATALPAADYGAVGLALVVLALLLSGGRRVRHLRYLDDDPIVQRFLGAAPPADATHGRAVAGGRSGAPSPSPAAGECAPRRARHPPDGAASADHRCGRLGRVVVTTGAANAAGRL